MEKFDEDRSVHNYFESDEEPVPEPKEPTPEVLEVIRETKEVFKFI